MATASFESTFQVRDSKSTQAFVKSYSKPAKVKTATRDEKAEKEKGLALLAQLSLVSPTR